MPVIDLSKTFAFFLEEMDRHYGYSARVLGSKDHELVHANWVGPAIGGRPAVIQEGHVTRPINHATYEFVGEAGPGPGQIKFDDVSRASPDNVLSKDSGYARDVKEPTAVYGFFSDHMHRKLKGFMTVQGARHPSIALNIRANWVGPSVGGRPGLIVDGRILRPAKPETYELIGEVGPQGLFFFDVDENSRAAPENVLMGEGTEEEKVYGFFSPRLHRESEGRDTVIAVAKNGRRLFVNWIGYRINDRPATIQNNRLVYPDYADEFRFMGEIGPNGLEFPERPSLSRPPRAQL